MEKSNETISLDLTVILVTDKETGLVSATCAQFPEAMAQGANNEDAVNNLAHLIPFVLYDKGQEALRQFPVNNPYTSAHLKGSLAVTAA